jgi:hypothetical protein
MAALSKDVNVKRWTGDPPVLGDDPLLTGHAVTIVAQCRRGVTVEYVKDAENRRGLVEDRTAFAEADLSPNPPYGEST